ncbi:FkbM family methyltransferase [Lachnospiraceae bacterium 48-42]
METAEMIRNLGEIYEMLGDELSKQRYLDRLNWLVTGDFRYVRRIVERSHPSIPVWNGREEKEFIRILPKNKKIIFYGTGSFSQRLIPYLKEENMEPVFCDSSAEKQGTDFYGFQVITPSELFGMTEPKSIVICTTKYMEEVRACLLEHGIEEKEIIDIRAFFKCGTGDDYFYEDFLHYSDQEVFIDAGCYDLGTTADFARVCRGLKKVYAFEPDPANYKNCLERLEKERESFPPVSLYPNGTWSSTVELRFCSTADGCAHIGEGESVIKAVAIDEVVEESDRVTFIKMDVEGAELESLKGAQEVIKRDRPKLAVCIYHKPEDIITLPMYIKELVPEYRLYLRSYSNADNEMVLYAVLPS